jgi:hypothetical protein
VHREVFEFENEINIEKLSAGIYFYEIRIKNHVYASGKIMKH